MVINMEVVCECFETNLCSIFFLLTTSLLLCWCHIVGISSAIVLFLML